MKLEIYMIILILFYAQSQEPWKSVHVAFSGSNWDDQGWNIQNLYGDKFSYCGQQKIFGGHSNFGGHTFVSKYFILPPHYSIKVSFTFYKIDSWDDEYFQLTIDNIIQLDSFTLKYGDDICGLQIFSDLVIPISYIISHRSQSVVVMMTSNLDEIPSNESWGFNNFEIQILACPEECQYCKDSTSDCYFWSKFVSFWTTSFDSEGWQTDNNQPLTSSLCGGISILGGNPVLVQGQQIQILLDNLPIHYEVQTVLKLWVIGDWSAEAFTFLVDDQIEFTISIQTGGYLNYYCGSYIQVKIMNFNKASKHSSDKIKFTLRTQQIIHKNAFWGVQSFDLFTVICPKACEECYGYKQSECSKCIAKWVFLNDACIPVPPIECCQVRIAEQEFSSGNLFEMYIEEIDTKYIDKGQKKLVLNENLSYISFQVYVRCQEKLNIQSFFRSCDQCQLYQFSYSNQCTNKTLIYTASFMQVLKYEKEFLITISENYLQIDQLLRINIIEEEVLILKVNI